ncbi:hypothetical protein JCGZ_18625 [Jatropha curcas]|uniref:Cytochrome P450 n=1 Tax=Jatropha curcas TaxID=180498 RepID=A0A067KBR5_JATCU|nr:hypothetical protein JCGZ_18625 [Jatropha curcas]
MSISNLISLNQQWLPILAVFLLPIFTLFLFKSKKRTEGPKLPPGPRRLPIIGNFHQLGDRPYYDFWKMSQKHGPVMRVQLGRSPGVVISGAEASREAMKDHDLDTCSRPLSVGPGTTIFINAYAIGREPSKWENPEEFYPERFENSDVDYRGSYFELVPFGAGRRTCPGLAMGTTAVKYTLANLLYGFDFELPNGKKFEDFPMEEAGGPTIHNKHDLVLIPKKHEWD